MTLHRPRKSRSKMLAVAVVVAAGVIRPTVPAGSAWQVACDVIIAVGAAVGIASAGLTKEK